MSTAATVERGTQAAASSGAARRLARAGLAARGVEYLLLAYLAVSVAAGSGQRADSVGALQAVARQPFGFVALVLLAAGFAGFALWRFLRAAGGRSEGSGLSPWARRSADVAAGAVYVALTVAAAGVLAGRGQSSGGDREQAWTSRLMQATWGRWLVGAVGLAVVGVGIGFAVRGLTQKFQETLRTDALAPWQRRWFPRLGLVGYTARGVVFGLVGAFVVRAALLFDPNEPVGMDETLHEVARSPYGPPLLALTALGLTAFAAFSFVEARYRKVLEAA